MSSKIKKTHLERRACVYLRQSTPHQVEFNSESTERQYALATRAHNLGWDNSQIHVLDGDLGKSGQTTTGREDFHRLMAAVGLGEVGAVFALEASRFSRSQADWHKLIDICALTDTLVIDHDGVYDPNDFNDRVLLGFKGTWSHTELHGMRLRLQGAKLNKAKKGELRTAPPTGYVYDTEGNLVLDPDESVVAAIGLVFQQFCLLGTAFKVMRFFAINQIPFPRRLWRPGEIGTLHWGSVNHSRITAILHNPTYTGTYVYGRRRSVPVIESGQISKVRTQQLPQEEWKVIIHNSHQGYITWEQYLENLEQLKCNHHGMEQVGQAIPREGAALLQGLVICGQCGRRMSPRYYGTGGKRSAYECNQLRKQNGEMGMCWSVAACAIDVAVATHVLQAITAEQLDISLAVLHELDQQAAELEHHWQLRLERARYESERAERQFDAVEPENRLVARTLEKRWNEKLQHLAELEQAYLSARQVQRLQLSHQQRQQILQLAKDLPALWYSNTTTAQERKQMLSLLVRQVALTPVSHPERSTRIDILWHTGATTFLVVARPTTGDKLRTPAPVIEIVKQLASSRTDAQIASELNQRGLLSGKGRTFTEASVAWIRWKEGISKPGNNNQVAHHQGIRSDGSYSTTALANELRVSIHTIHYWRQKGVIEAFQETDGGPWWHKVTPDVLDSLRRYIRRVPVKSE